MVKKTGNKDKEGKKAKGKNQEEEKEEENIRKIILINFKKEKGGMGGVNGGGRILGNRGWTVGIEISSLATVNKM